MRDEETGMTKSVVYPYLMDLGRVVQVEYILLTRELDRCLLSNNLI